jgi:hypothetical protein
MRLTMTLGLIGLAVACLAPVAVAADDAMRGLPLLSDQTAPPAPSAEDLQHLDKGEVKYGDQWIDVTALFGQYQQAQKDLQDLRDQKKTSDDQLQEIAKTLAASSAQFNRDSAAVRTAQNTAQAALNNALAWLAMAQPQQPTDYPDPVQPNRGTYTNDAAYNGAVNDWNRRVDQNRRDNQTRRDNYNRNLDTWRSNQQQAGTARTNAQNTLDDCRQQLADLTSARQTRDVDPLAQKKKLVDEASARGQQLSAFINKTSSLLAAIKTCPDSILLARGIVDFRNHLYSADEIQAMVEALKAQIAADKKTAEDKAGEPMPDTWSHPKQIDLNELKIDLDRLETAKKSKV